MRPPLGTSQFSSPLFVIALVLATLLGAVAAPQLIRFWRHTTTFFDVADRRSYFRARTRCFPTLAAGGLGLLVDGWIFVLDPPSHGYDVVTSIVLVIFGAVFLGSGVVGPAVLLFNRPRWLVPPHLRGDPGYLEVRRRGPKTGTTTRR
jgi:hypothetical protein